MLRATNIAKDYNDGIRNDLHVLNDISFSLAHGETSAIIGSSGSGKTTLLNILGGLDEPTSGQVLLNDIDVHKLSERQRCIVRNKHFGFIYQFHHLLPEFTALENVAMPLLIKGSSIAQARQRAEKVLANVGLVKRYHHKPGELSGGERQRAAIARALVHQPECILADEPTGNLDRKNAEQAIELIIDLNKQYNTSLVIVTHDLKIAERMDTIYTLEDGVLKHA
jgi:lipoprotein-releasing system ATP-binding protein